MGLKAGETNITITVSQELHDKLHQEAHACGMRVSRMLAGWLIAGMAGPVAPTKRRTHIVRAYKDELMLSLPMAFVRQAGLRKHSRVMVYHGAGGLLAVPEDRKG